MRLEQLRYLQVVARRASFRRAADELDIAQPSLSQAIQQLERELGARLLIRGRSGARATDVGAAVLPYVARILELADSMRDEVAGHAGLLRGHLQLGTVASGTNTVLPSVLGAFCQQHPGVDVMVKEGGSLDILADVRSGDLEFALFIDEVGRPDTEGLATVELLRSPLVAYMPAGHPLLLRKRIRVEQLSGERLIVFPAGYLMHKVSSRLMERHVGNAVFQTDNAESAKRMVAAGVGVLLIPEFSVVDKGTATDGTVAYVPLSDAPVIRLGLAKRNDRPLLRAAEVVWGMCVAEASRQLGRRQPAAPATVRGQR